MGRGRVFSPKDETLGRLSRRSLSAIDWTARGHRGREIDADRFPLVGKGRINRIRI